jgi:hypothetical protein
MCSYLGEFLLHLDHTYQNLITLFTKNSYQICMLSSGCLKFMTHSNG